MWSQSFPCFPNIDLCWRPCDPGCLALSLAKTLHFWRTGSSNPDCCKCQHLLNIFSLWILTLTPSWFCSKCHHQARPWLDVFCYLIICPPPTRLLIVKLQLGRILEDQIHPHWSHLCYVLLCMYVCILRSFVWRIVYIVSNYAEFCYFFYHHHQHSGYPPIYPPSWAGLGGLESSGTCVALHVKHQPLQTWISNLHSSSLPPPQKRAAWLTSSKLTKPSWIKKWNSSR